MILEQYINNHLLKNDSLFNYIYVIEQKFSIVPEQNNHYGTSIAFQDLTELRKEFLDELYDSIIDWVYSSKKYAELKNIAIKKGKTESAAAIEIGRRAVDKFRATKNAKSI